MELTIQVNPAERTVRFRETHALAAGDAYSSLVVAGVAGAQTAALQLKLYRDSSASGVLAQCSSFSDVPGHPSVRRGAITFATQALKTWYEEIVDDATVTDANGMPSALVNAWLVISDSVKTWAACQVPLILRAMDTNVVQGADGISPTVSLSKSGSVLTISITDVNGTHTETVSDGQDGPPGVSPTVVVDVNPATGNVRVTAVNADGSTTTREVDVSGKAEKSEMSVTAGSDATKKTVQLKSGLSQEVLVAHQDVSGKMDSAASYPAWSESEPYEGPSVVSYNGRFYRVKGSIDVDYGVNYAVGTPPDESELWEQVYLKDLKQDALSPEQLAAVNSGATAAKVAVWDGYAAQIAQKANTSDLPYALVSAQQTGDWQFSGDGVQSGHTYTVDVTDEEGYWEYVLKDNGTTISTADIGTLENTVDFSVSGSPSADITATRAWALQDRAGNAVLLSVDATLQLPAANPGYLRDFLVRLEISGTVPTITFAAPTGETITYETDGDEFPVPDEAGNWVYSFTENCVAHTFAVSLKKVNTVAAPQAQGGS